RRRGRESNQAWRDDSTPFSTQKSVGRVKKRNLFGALDRRPAKTWRATSRRERRESEASALTIAVGAEHRCPDSWTGTPGRRPAHGSRRRASPSRQTGES